MKNSTKNEWDISSIFTTDILKNCDNPFLGILDKMMRLYPELQGKRKEFFLILSELYRNALEHGVLKLNTQFEKDLTAMEGYFTERGLALQELDNGWIKIDIRFKKFIRGMNIVVRVEDSGKGFVYRSPGKTMPDTNHFHGRGLLIVKSLCKELKFYGDGNLVEVVYIFTE